MKILAIDDSPFVLKAIEEALTEYDLQLLCAWNGAEGLHLALAHSPDLILLDLNLPVISGPEVLEKLHKNKETQKIPVVILTGDNRKETVIKLIKMGVNGYLCKPFEAEELIKKIKAVVTLTKREVLSVG